MSIRVLVAKPGLADCVDMSASVRSCNSEVLGGPAVVVSLRPVALRHNLSRVLPLSRIEYCQMPGQMQGEVRAF